MTMQQVNTFPFTPRPMRQSNYSKLVLVFSIYTRFELSLNLYNFSYHSILLKSIQPFLILCFTIYIFDLVFSCK